MLCPGMWRKIITAGIVLHCNMVQALPPCRGMAGHARRQAAARCPGGRETLLASFPGHLHGQARQHAAHHPALQQHPAGAARQEARNRPGQHGNYRIDGHADGDLHRSQRHRLRQHAAVPGCDELRQQRQIHDGDLRVGQVGDQAHEKQLARPVGGQIAHGKGRAPAWFQRLPGQVQQIGGTAKAQHVVGVGHGEDEGRDAERGTQHVEDEAQGHSAQGNEAGAPALADGAGNQVDHVGAGRERHAQGHESEHQQGGYIRHAIPPEEMNAMRGATIAWICACRAGRRCAGQPRVEIDYHT